MPTLVSLLVAAGLLLASVTAQGQASPPPSEREQELLSQIDALIAEGIAAGDLTGCVLLVGSRDKILYEQAYGHRILEPEPVSMTVETVFDMASITKPVATATSVMLLVERGLVRLGDRAAKYIPEFGANGKKVITIEQLLTHQAGLIPDNALQDYLDGPEKSWERIYQLEPTWEPGTVFKYTDVGFLMLGKLVEEVTGRSLAEFTQNEIFAPLKMTDTGYTPGPELRDRAAPTEPRDGQMLQGVVHDPRAALLEGVAGHAGLFSTARDLAKYAQMMLGEGSRDGVRVLGTQTVREMIRPRDVAGNQRALGWDVKSSYSRNRGAFYSTRAFGHGGFTGTVLWIDPELDFFLIFLSSRLYPDGEGSVNDLAGRIGTVATAIWANDAPAEFPRPVTEAAAGGSPRPGLQAEHVLAGVDVLAANDFQPLAGSRIGLITNHTGRTRDGTATADLLHRAENVELGALFSPEHGIAGLLDQPTIDDDANDAGVPIYSLYGQTRKPTREQLAGLDTLVFDIQDIGTRFYTYISTMGLAMEAAAEQGIRFVVLDRPNPITGTVVTGPMLDEGRESFVGFHALPIRHGMTIGELARMFKRERNLDLDLVVIPVENWNRGMWWDETGLTWVNPSPNMRCLTQALLYPGIGILETTNLSVGRGTDTPFEIVGAPWIKQNELADRMNALNLPGVTFIPVRFTPDSSKYAEEECGGINIMITDREAIEPVRTGIELARCLQQLYDAQWDTTGLMRLLGNKATAVAILEEADSARLQALIDADVDDFQTRRRTVLMY